MNSATETTIDNTTDLMDVETGELVDTTTLAESIPTPKKVKKEKVAKPAPVYNTLDLSNIAKGLELLNGTPGDLTMYRGEFRFKTDLTELVKSNERLIHDLNNIGWSMNAPKNFIGFKLQ